MGSSHGTFVSRLASLLSLCCLSLCLVNSQAAEPAPSPRPVSKSPAKFNPIEGAPAGQPVEATAPTLTGPKSAPYLIELKARNVPKGTAILWDVYAKDARSGLFFAEGGAQTRVIKSEQALLLAGPQGAYRVKARLVKGEDATELVWDGELTGGQPAPIPPNPPGPNPPAPDAFYTDVANAYKADTTADKATAAIKLSGLYRAAAKSTVNDPTIKTYGELTADMVKAGKAIFPQGTLPKVREAIAKRLDPLLGVDLARPLTPADRAKCAAEFNTVADALLAAIK